MNLSELIKGKTIHQVLPFLKTAMTFFTYIHSDAHTERVLHKAFAAKRFPSTRAHLWSLGWGEVKTYL